MRIDYLDVNNYKQGVVVVDNDLTKPLLIFVHGGPGSPEFALFEQKCPELFDYFICCFPEQRGAGLSAIKKITAADLQVDVITADTIAITEHYLKKYNKEKAYIMGHSWGSVIAPHVAKKRPDLYHAYIGIGQVNQQRLSEKEGYEFIIQKAREHGDKKTLNKLLANKPTKDYLLSMEYMRIRSTELNRYGAAFWHKEKISGMTLLKYMLKSKIYSKTYSIKFLKGNYGALKHGLKLLTNVHLEKEIIELEVPMYIIQGYHDLQTSFNQAQLFFSNVEAPEKKFFVFHDSAHCPMLDEKEKFMEVVTSICL